jgi:FKBP-type peptidyl-prolyl cis-trans isomerase FkpA
MKRNLMFLALATIGLESCNGGFKKGDNGMLYNINVDKSGPKIKQGDFLTVNLTIKNDADSLLVSTYDQGHAAPLMLQKSATKGDIFDALQLLAEGDSATIKVLVDSVYKGRPKPQGFKGKYLVYNVKVEKVIPKGTLTDQVFQSQVSDYMKKQNDVLKGQEPAKIKKYIDDNKLAVTKTATGLNYVITKPGTGALPVAGDTVTVNYVGKYVNGKVFDTNIKEEAVKGKLTINPMNPYKAISIPVGQGAVIPGWDQGLMLLNTGAKATFVIPSDLAYRDQGNQIIGPYTPLVFEVELVKITHPNPNAPKPVAPTAPTAQQIQQMQQQMQRAQAAKK